MNTYNITGQLHIGYFIFPLNSILNQLLVPNWVKS